MSNFLSAVMSSILKHKAIKKMIVEEIKKYILYWNGVTTKKFIANNKRVDENIPSVFENEFFENEFFEKKGVT